jgi:hypothetical protein
LDLLLKLILHETDDSCNEPTYIRFKVTTVIKFVLIFEETNKNCLKKQCRLIEMKNRKDFLVP